MATSRNYYVIGTGLKLKGQNSVAPANAGEIRYNSSTNRLQIYDTALRNITTDDGTATFTNKTFDAEGSGNVLSNITNTHIKASAAIAYSKLNLASSIVNADISNSAAIAYSKLNLASSIVNADISNSASIAYSKLNLAGSIVNADISNSASIAYSKLNLANSVRASDINSQAAASGTILTANGSGGATFATPASAPDSSLEVSNLGLAASVSANALTISLKTKAGTDPTGSDIVKIGFRNSTSTTGTYNQRTVTSALSLTISSGSTLGHESAKTEYIFVYAIDNTGTVELAVSSSLYDEGSVVSTTAEGGAGEADSRNLIYSATARSNVPVRLIGRLKSNQTTAGTWATAISEISLLPFEYFYTDDIWLTGGSGHGSTANRIRRFTTIQRNWGTSMTLTQDSTNGDKITINRTGVYHITYADSASATANFGIGLNTGSSGTVTPQSLSANERLGNARTSPNDAGNQVHECNFTGILRAGDEIRCHTDGVNGTADLVVYFRIARVC